MFFDDVLCKGGVGVVVVFIIPQDEVLSFFFAITWLCSNNMAYIKTPSLAWRFPYRCNFTNSMFVGILNSLSTNY